MTGISRFGTHLPCPSTLEEWPNREGNRVATPGRSRYDNYILDANTGILEVCGGVSCGAWLFVRDFLQHIISSQTALCLGGSHDFKNALHDDDCAVGISSCLRAVNEWWINLTVHRAM